MKHVITTYFNSNRRGYKPQPSKKNTPLPSNPDTDNQAGYIPPRNPDTQDHISKPPKKI